MISKERLENNFDLVGQISGAGNGITRLAFSEEDWGCRKFILKLMKNAGLAVRTDNFGNIIGRREGKEPTAPVVMCGSHIDSVPNGGNFDGMAGVLGAIECLQAMQENNVQNDHPIEVVVFMCEESSRFGVATLGSKAMCGKLDSDMLKKLVDQEGTTLYSILKLHGLNADKVEEAVYPNQVKAFLEMHIEQGKILEMEQKQIGIVTGIAAPTRLAIKIKGHADHSGTTPMHMRHDALCGAAEIILMIENIASCEKNVVATVGIIEALPGVMNVIPGMVTLKVDIRSLSLDARIRVVKTIQQHVETICKERDLEVKTTTLTNENPVPLDEALIDELSKICEENDFSYMKLPSGASHDAMQWAAIVPTGMIFIPCENGMSHCPEEYAEICDIVAGTKVLYDALCRLAEK